MAGQRDSATPTSVAMVNMYTGEPEKKTQKTEGKSKLGGKFKSAAKRVMMSLAVVREMRRGTFPYANADGELALKTKLIYAAPSLSLLSLTMFITLHANIYYESRGASLSFIAFFTAVARSFDVITDPLMGWISDSTRSRWGRRRPYIFCAGIGYAAAFVALMSPPTSLSDSDINFWYGASYIIFYLFDTVANVPYAAWGPELTDDSRERESVYFWRGLFDKLGVMFGAAAPAVFLGFLSDANAYSIVAVIFGIYYIVAVYFLVIYLREREKSQETRPIPLVPSVLRAFKNVAFRPLLIGWTLDYMALGMVAAMFPFFVKFVILPDDPETVQAIALGCLFIASCIGMLMWKQLSIKYGKRRIWLAYNLVNSVTTFFFLALGEGDELALYVLAFLNGIPVGGQFLIEAILSDVIDYDEFLNGTRSEGSFTVFATFIPKVVSIPSSAIPLAIISAVGFVPSVDGEEQPQPDSVKLTIQIIFCVIPSVLTVLSFLVKLRYPIVNEKMNDQISDGILKHEKGEAAYDPITTAPEVILLELTEEEQNTAWLLDNFGWKVLLRYAAGDKPALVCQMITLIVIGITSFVVFIATIILTFPLIDDETWLWTPSMAAIMAGMSLCFITVSILRYRSAKVLTKMDPPVDLVKKIIAHKKKGQRGGDAHKDLLQRGATIRAKTKLFF